MRKLNWSKPLAISVASAIIQSAYLENNEAQIEEAQKNIVPIHQSLLIPWLLQWNLLDINCPEVAYCHDDKAWAIIRSEALQLTFENDHRIVLLAIVAVYEWKKSCQHNKQEILSFDWNWPSTYTKNILSRSIAKSDSSLSVFPLVVNLLAIISHPGEIFRVDSFLCTFDYEIFYDALFSNWKTRFFRMSKIL